MGKSGLITCFTFFILTAFLAGCDSSGSSNVFFAPPINKNYERLGFYDIDKNGIERVVRNDITGGSLSGMVQFGQSHIVDSSGNSAKEMPLIVAEREALLLFTPTPGIATSIKNIKAEVSIAGKVKTFEMAPPDKMPASDYYDNRGRQDISYSNRSWFATLPWDMVKPGISIKFIDNMGRSGVLESSGIEFGVPAEGVFVFLRLGMLTDYPTDGDGSMMTDPAHAMTEYFQTVPYSKLVAVRYEDRSLSKVIVASGEIYDTESPDPAKRVSRTSGDVYSGDMRENVGKSQISVGINLANYGITSWNMFQSYTHLFFQMTVHLAQGAYSNGIVRHGLSGGNGIGTLIDTVNNEFSHEVGHAYGLGHYPGSNGNDYFWSAHHADSGWGYDAYKKRMRANIDWRADGTGAFINGVKSNITFMNLYSYGKDAMSGGAAISAISRYTHHTGYTAKRIQNNLAGRPVISSSSETGYRKWNPETMEMDEYAYPEKDKRLKPYKIGVPVITIIGGYDPDDLSKSVMYPYFRGNYGNVFNLPEPIIKSGVKSCWVKVDFKDGSSKKIALLAERNHKNSINQYAINIEESLSPVNAALFCRDAAGSEKAMAKLPEAIPTNLKPMQAAVIIGRENGFIAAKNADIAFLNKGLPVYKNDEFPNLTVKQAELVNLFADQLNLLNSEAKTVAERYLKWLARGEGVEDYLKTNSNLLDIKDSKTVEGLLNMLVSGGMAGTAEKPLAEFGLLKVVGKCLESYRENGADVVRDGDCLKDKVNQQWVMDRKGRLHSGENPALCVTGNGYAAPLIMKECSEDKGQSWEYRDNDGLKLRWGGNDGQWCMDHAYGSGKPVLYPCHGNGNQQWTAPVKSNYMYLVILKSKSIARLHKILFE